MPVSSEHPRDRGRSPPISRPVCRSTRSATGNICRPRRTTRSRDHLDRQDHSARRPCLRFGRPQPAFRPSGRPGGLLGRRRISPGDDFLRPIAGPGGRTTSTTRSRRCSRRRIQVKEAFGEILVPVLSDLPFAHELTVDRFGSSFELQGHGRGRSGPTASTASGRRSPISRSAPAMLARSGRRTWSELFSAQGQNFATGCAIPARAQPRYGVDPRRELRRGR